MKNHILLIIFVFFAFIVKVDAQNIYPVGEYMQLGKVEFSNLEVKNSILYFPLGKLGLQILDVTNPQNVTQKSIYNEFEWREKKKVFGSAYCVNISGDSLFLAYGELGLKILNISDPSMPFVLGTYYRYQDVYACELYKNFAFLGLKNMGFEIVDFSNIDNIDMVSRNNVKDFKVENLQVRPPFVLMTGGYRGILIYQFTDPFTKFKVKGFPKNYNPNNEANKLIVKDNIGYLANDFEGLTILNLGLTLYPVKMSNIKTNGKAKDICLNKNYAYVSGGNAIEVFDISDNENPVMVFEHKEKKKKFENIVIEGNYLYASFKQSFRKYGIMIFKIE